MKIELKPTIFILKYADLNIYTSTKRSMGNLVMILVLTLGALLMLESVQAVGCNAIGQEGYVYVLQMGGKAVFTKQPCGEHGAWYKVGATINPKKRYEVLQAGNPYPLVEVGKFYVSDCFSAEKKIKEDKNLKFASGGGGKEWYLAKSPDDLLKLKNVVDKHVSKYPIQGGDDNKTNSRNFRRRLQSLLKYLLN